MTLTTMAVKTPTPNTILSELSVSLSNYRSSAIYPVLILITACLMALRWSKGSSRHSKLWREPPTYPSGIPILGHLLWMAWDSPKFISSVITRFKNIPVRLRLAVTDVYVVSGSESIKAVWKEPDLHSNAYRTLSVQNILNLPDETLAFYMDDDSGHHAQPHPDSRVPAHLRIDYLNHSSISKFLTGDGLKPLAGHFIRNLTGRLLSTDSMRSEWSNFPDLFAFMQGQLFPAAVEALCGHNLMLENPTFVEDFWAFNKALPGLAKHYPRWLFPESYRARDKCLDSLKRWHKIIWNHFDDLAVNYEGWTPEYGAEIVKVRHLMWSRMPRMNADAAAAEDLGMIWAANGNSIPNSFWMVAEVIRNTELLSRVRRTIDSYRVDADVDKIDFDYAKLCADPLLQSIYAETLRLHVASFLMRGSARTDLDLKGWRVPRDAVMLISSYNAQTDSTAWCTNGKRPSKPVEVFCAERFLEYPKLHTDCTHPSSKEDHVAVGVQGDHRPKLSTEDIDIQPAPKFSLKDRSGDWIPYGGGQRMCPGRHFAKQEMISSLAIMLTLYDIELLDEEGRIPDNDMEGFGFGALWPKGATPVRMKVRSW